MSFPDNVSEPQTISLDSLAQVRKRGYNDTEATIQETLNRWQRNAERKGVSLPIHVALAELRNERESYYRNCIYCAGTLVIKPDGKIRANYCNGRLCPICQAIRTAKAMNKYLPTIETFGAPHFLTLTRQTVRDDMLLKTVEQMKAEFTRSKDTLRKVGIKLHGLRKLEITCTDSAGRFNPHFHCIIEGEEQANAILDEWMKRHHSIARLEAQCLKFIDSTNRHALRTIFGYVTKLITPFEQGGQPVPPECLDTIVAAVSQKRVLQPFGSLYGRGKDPDGPIQVEPVSYRSSVAFGIGEHIVYNWQQDAQTWIDRSTGELFVPSGKK